VSSTTTNSSHTVSFKQAILEDEGRGIRGVPEKEGSDENTPPCTLLAANKRQNTTAV
jgi:hypothetical protein